MIVGYRGVGVDDRVGRLYDKLRIYILVLGI